VKAREAVRDARCEARSPYLRIGRLQEKLNRAITRLRDNGIFANDLTEGGAA